MYNQLHMTSIHLLHTAIPKHGAPLRLHMLPRMRARISLMSCRPPTCHGRGRRDTSLPPRAAGTNLFDADETAAAVAEDAAVLPRVAAAAPGGAGLRQALQQRGVQARACRPAAPQRPHCLTHAGRALAAGSRTMYKVCA
jgi:hypothetical protein